MIHPYLALAISISISILGQLMFKAGSFSEAKGFAIFFQPYTLGALASYGISAAFYIIAIRAVPISVAYPSISITYVAVALGAHFIWGENFGLPQIVALFFIFAGIFILFRFQ